MSNGTIIRKFSDDIFDIKKSYISYKWCSNCLIILNDIKCIKCSKICQICSDSSGCGTIFCKSCKEVYLKICNGCNIDSSQTKNIVLYNGKWLCQQCL